MRKFVCVLAMGLMATSAAVANLSVPSAVVMAATDFSGVWVGNITMPSGDALELTYTLKQDGAVVTGTVGASQGDAIQIEDGKVDGDKLTFNVTYNGSTIKNEGVINGDEMKMTAKSDDPSFPGAEMTLKRVKEPAVPAPAPAPATTPAPPPAPATAPVPPAPNK